MVNDLDYADIKFSVTKKDYSKIEQKNNIPSMYFLMKMIWFILPINQTKNVKITWIYCY